MALLKSVKRRLAQGLMMAAFSLAAAAAGAQDQSEPPSLWYTKPAATWTEALPLGNGRIGAMDFGGLEDERIQTNESSLWGGGPHRYADPQARAHLQEVRKLLFAGDVGKAEGVAKDMLGSPALLPAYLPFVDVRLHFPGHANASAYEHRLDLGEAIARTTYTVGDVRYRREVFVSYPDQVLVLRLTASKAGALNFGVDLASVHRSTQVTSRGGDELELTGQVQPQSNPAYSWIASWDRPGERFAALLKVSVDTGHVRADGTRLEISGATTATVLFSGGTSFRNYRDISGDALALAKKHIDLASQRSYETLLQRHVEDFRALFLRTRLSLGAASIQRPTDERLRHFAHDDDAGLVALYYAFGRYLLIASSRQGGQPANLQGIWNEDLMPAWGSKWTTNINLQMNYWPADAGDLWETQEPLWHLIRDLRQSGAETARAHYGARGWVLHHNTDLWRATTPVDGTWGLWPMGGVWLANQMWGHYSFSGDDAFLRRDAYPAMKGAVEFVLDTLVETPAGTPLAGKLVTSPSTSPENQYLMHGEPHHLTYGSTMDIELVDELLDNFVIASTRLHLDEALRVQVEQARKRLPPLQIGRRGQLQEWIEDYPEAEPTHRHVSHLYALYPGHGIDVDRTPELTAAARKTLELRGDGGTGWSRAWRIALWARLRDPAQAYANLKLLLTGSTLPNMFDTCPPFQIDGNFGGVAGITEMLIQSKEGEIRVLPALPKEWPEGHLLGVRVRGGAKVDLAWHAGHLTRFVLHADHDESYRVVYGQAVTRIEARPGVPVVLDGDLQTIVDR